MRNHIIKVHSSGGTFYDIHLPISDAGLTEPYIKRHIESFLEQNIKNVESWSQHKAPAPSQAPLLKLDDYITVMRFWAIQELSALLR